MATTPIETSASKKPLNSIPQIFETVFGNDLKSMIYEIVTGPKNNELS
jgi:hypothetical protein